MVFSDGSHYRDYISPGNGRTPYIRYTQGIPRQRQYGPGGLGQGVVDDDLACSVTVHFTTEFYYTLAGVQLGCQRERKLAIQ